MGALRARGMAVVAVVAVLVIEWPAHVSGLDRREGDHAEDGGRRRSLGSRIAVMHGNTVHRQQAD